METVRVIYHSEAEGWWAESPDIEGWSVAGDSYGEVRALVDAGVEFAIDHATSRSSTSFRPTGRSPRKR